MLQSKTDRSFVTSLCLLCLPSLAQLCKTRTFRRLVFDPERISDIIFVQRRPQKTGAVYFNPREMSFAVKREARLRKEKSMKPERPCFSRKTRQTTCQQTITFKIEKYIYICIRTFNLTTEKKEKTNVRESRNIERSSRIRESSRVCVLFTRIHVDCVSRSGHTCKKYLLRAVVFNGKN